MATLMEKEAALELMAIEIGRITTLTSNIEEIDEFFNNPTYQKLLTMRRELRKMDCKKFKFSIFQVEINQIRAIFDDMENAKKKKINNETA